MNKLVMNITVAITVATLLVGTFFSYRVSAIGGVHIEPICTRK